jgi:hypothetical protein
MRGAVLVLCGIAALAYVIASAANALATVPAVAAARSRIGLVLRTE